MFKKVLFLSALCVSNLCIAGNWNGTLTAKIQADNRISNETSYSSEIWGTYEYRGTDNNWRLGYDFLLRGSDLDSKTDDIAIEGIGYESGYTTYQAFVEKTFSRIGTTFKAGRFQRSDNLGFYLLDGVDIHYQTPENLFSFNLYGGKPLRLDNLKAETGDLMYGANMMLHFTPRWEGGKWILPISLDILDIRFGFQQFNNQINILNLVHENNEIEINDPTRLSFGINLEGRILNFLSEKFEIRLQGTYRMDKKYLEDMVFEAQLDVNEAFRLRYSYEIYDPHRTSYPTFRERYYNYSNFGHQSLSRASADYKFFDALTLSLGALHSNREYGDVGNGLNAALKIKPWPGHTITLAADYLELGNESIYSLWFGLKHSLTSKMTVEFQGILRQENKLLYGDNQVTGGEIKVDYMLQNNLVLSLDANYIRNSNFGNEHLGRFQVTYYFDNFKAKAR
ncbi:MAG: hypothetical protein KAU26_10690 [Methylococcales bacterium]|nr:hypothetical protein [Methylococcales bacterium]